MTEKLYYEDPYIKEFTAEIMDIVEKDNEFHIELDKTAFFPGGGGQPFDSGTIEDSQITTVYEKEGSIYHVSSKKPIKIHKAKCKINWEQRFGGMQQHLGQHIFSAAVYKLYGGNTLNFQMIKDICIVDIDKLLNDEDVEKVEILSNNIIFERRKVTFLTPTKAELKKLSLRKESEILNKELRVVKIEDFDITTCSGLHPATTIEVQLIKIINKDKIKGNMRIEFICGRRAVLESMSKYEFSNKICKNLHCGEREVLGRIESLNADLGNLQNENKSLKSQVADFEVQALLENSESLSGIRIVKNIFADKDMKYVNLLASKLTSYGKVIVLYALKAEGMANLLFMCSKDLKNINMNELLKDAISLIDGKGGGSSSSAQGGGKGLNNLNSAMDYAYMKIKNVINSK